MTSDTYDPTRPGPPREVAEDAAARETQGRWREYSEERPPEAGAYEWSVPSRVCEGMRVIVLARYRKRGAGAVSMLSPEFDHWDGYRVTVPEGTRWREAPDRTDLTKYQLLVGVEGLEFVPCPLCGTEPKLKASEKWRDGGVTVCPPPQRFNSWWLECCAWMRTPHYSDPRELEKVRRAKIAGGFNDR